MIVDHRAVPLLQDAGLGVRVAAIQHIEGGSEYDGDPPGPDDVCFIQYSSGSTGRPKGCMHTPRGIAWQLGALEQALKIDPAGDTGVVWLPMSHDMGLIGCVLLTYWTGHRLVMSTPERFVTQPATWLDDCARYQATISAAPNFALDLVARAARHHLPPPFPMRRLVVGGERVAPETLHHASTVLGPDRLPMSSLVPAYGLAEAVLAVSMTPVGEGPKISSFDREALDRGIVAPAEDAGSETAVTLASAGTPLRDTEVSILPEGRHGQIRISTPALALGYLGDAELTSERFTPRGLLTGDTGYVYDGHVFIMDRIDGAISIAGRTVYAGDAEAAMSQVKGVRSGGCALVDAGGGATGRLVGLIETVDRDPDFRRLARAVATAARHAAGVVLEECIFLNQDDLPKTSSGKLQRFRCRQIARDGGELARARVVP